MIGSVYELFYFQKNGEVIVLNTVKQNKHTIVILHYCITSNMD